MYSKKKKKHGSVYIRADHVSKGKYDWETHVLLI